jgi:hypothetical protein
MLSLGKNKGKIIINKNAGWKRGFSACFFSVLLGQMRGTAWDNALA